MKSINVFVLFILAIFLFSCVEKTNYSGKIITENDLTNLNISNKKELILKFGNPSFIDSIQNKYFYYTQKNKKKNFYNEKTEYSYLFIFELNEDDKIISSETINLLNNPNNTFQKKITENNIVKRGFIEKIFGGVGPNQLPNSP